MGLLDEITPLKNKSLTSRESSAKEHYLKISKVNRTVTFSSKIINDLEIYHGMRVGIIKHPPHAKNYVPFMVMIYFTQNPIGTIELKKYKTSSWKFVNTEIIDELYMRFNKKYSREDFKLYINLSYPVKMNINGENELCFLLQDKVDLRKDLTDEQKREYHNFILEYYKEVK